MLFLCFIPFFAKEVALYILLAREGTTFWVNFVGGVFLLTSSTLLEVGLDSL